MRRIKIKKISDDQEIEQEEKEIRREYFIFVPLLLLIFVLLAFNFSKPTPKTVVELVHDGTNSGYWLVYDNGEVENFGTAPYVNTIEKAKDVDIVAAQTANNGFWAVSEDGKVYALAGAQYSGGVDKVSSEFTAGEMIGLPDGNAYRVTGSDGNIYAFNTEPIIGASKYEGQIAAAAGTSTGKGYWIIKPSGEITTFGDAANFSKVELTENVLVVDAATYGDGAIVLLNSGKVYIMGDGQNFGDLGADGLESAVVDIDPLPDGSGYRITQADGTVTNFGAAQELQSS